MSFANAVIINMLVTGHNAINHETSDLVDIGFDHYTIRYDTRCYFNVRSKAISSRLRGSARPLLMAATSLANEN